MKWLQDNPLGMALAGLSGGLILLAAILAVIWSLPVAVKPAGTVNQPGTDSDSTLVAHPVAALNEFQVINEKPVFNVSRRPVIAALDDGETKEDVSIEVRDAPDVRLTGVIITPSLRIASLTPKKGKQKSMMAHEGQPLTGEFTGWQVSSVKPRNVVLESQDGQQLELNLQVNDKAIKKPPRTKPVAKIDSAAGGKASGEDGQPLSRAEQIRERIAERRAELRREQEDKKAQSRQPQRRQPSTKVTDDQASTGQGYQNAIRALMGNNSKEKASNDKKDG